MAYSFTWPEPRYIAANQTTVQEQVYRGAKLRQEKHETYRLDAACVGFIQPPTCPTTDRYWLPSPIRSPKSGIGKLRSPSYLACTPACPSYPSVKKNITKPKPVPRCPMRIAELATPTKRQCIDTWRSKCDTLPGYMIERLRKQVMDECPVVGIPEAMYCFKRSKMPYIDRPCNVLSPRELRKRKRTEQRRNMCMMFGQKIAQELMSKRNITFNSQMDNLSKIVAWDIEKVVCSRKLGMKNPKYSIILDEVSARVTAWIMDILSDMSYKLLEDDLRDLEKTEGPVLDLLNALFNNVMKICEPDSSDYDESSKDGIISGEQEDTEVETSESLENVVFDISTPDSVAVDVQLGESDTEDVKTKIVKGVLDKILDFLRDTESGNDETIDDDIINAFNVAVKEIFEENSLFSAPDDKSTNKNVGVEEISFLKGHNDESLNIELSVRENQELNEVIDNNNTILKNNNVDTKEDNKKNLDKEADKLDDDVTGVKGNKTLDDESLIIELSVGENQELNKLIDNNNTILKNDNVDTEGDNKKNPDTEEDKLDDDVTGVIDKETLANESLIIELSVGENQQLNEVIDNNNTILKNNNVDTKEDNKKNLDKEADKLDDDVTGVIGNKTLDDESLIIKLSVGENQELNKLIDNNNTILKNDNVDTEEDNNKNLDTEVDKLDDSVTGVIDNEKADINPVLEENSFEDAIKDVENLNQDDSNVSAVFGIFIQDLNDESYKHVVFSDTNIGLTRKAVGSPRFEHGNKDGQISWNISTDHMRPNLVLPANQNLLSDADENWPEDITSTPIKITQSVNKSVTSLGRIQECDEILSPKDEGYVLVDGAGENIYSTIDLDNRAETLNTNLQDYNYNNLNSKMAEFNDNVLLYTNKNEALDYTDGIGKGDQRGTNETLKKQSQINKFDYKVHLDTAPPWVLSDHVKSCTYRNAMECKDLVSKQEKKKMYGVYIREWCEQLDHSIDHMEMWKKWIQNTCKQIISLKQREEMNKSIVCPRRKELVDWKSLKKKVERDADFWKKLYKHSEKLLKKRRQKYDLWKMLSVKQCDC